MMEYKQKYSLTNDTGITGDDIAVKDMLVQERPIKVIKKMYCRHCGKEVLESHNFCANCGYSIDNIIEQSKRTVSNIEKNHSTHCSEKIPMNWWNFWQYIRFPIGIILTAINIVDYLPTLDINMINILAFLIDLSIFVFMFITYYHFLMKNKIGYKFLNAWLVIELITNVLTATTNSFTDNYEGATLMDFAIPFVLTTCIVGIVWTLPNYIYFKNRKYSFDDSIKNSE